jgi:predicted nucleotidyltransferase
VQKALKGLKAVQIRSYQFASDFAYSTADIEAVRSQLSGPGWTPLTQVQDRKKNEDVDIYVALDDQKITGFAIISTEPREFTILNIVGAVDLEQFAKVQKQLGLPGATVARIPPQLL